MAQAPVTAEPADAPDTAAAVAPEPAPAPPAPAPVQQPAKAVEKVHSLTEKRQELTLQEPLLGRNVRIVELDLQIMLAMLPEARDKKLNLAILCLSRSMWADGRQYTYEELQTVGASKMRAMMRAASASMKLNGIADEEEAAPGEPPKNA